ncbi:membrane hypothetical protein [Verrucomicrobia bacterium]|nr:membrane hypothetical protein [Verrucomicrobiota bacterium]
MNGVETERKRALVSTQGGETYRLPFVYMTVLFFMWGFLTVWNDILIPRFKEAFALNYFQAMLVQFAWGGAYTVGALAYYVISMVSGDPINRIGYRNGVVIGLLIASAGSALFFPAALLTSYPFFWSPCSSWDSDLPCSRSPPILTSPSLGPSPLHPAG